jgi:hypothetical protein
MDSAWEQEKLEPRKMLENGGEWTAWLPDLYQNWTRFATSEQTMIYQDTPRFVGQFLP